MIGMMYYDRIVIHKMEQPKKRQKRGPYKKKYDEINPNNRTWVFTYNNYDEAVIDNIKAWKVNRMIVSKEVGESGTPHLQGAVTFCTVTSLKTAKVLLPKAHWEVAIVNEGCFNYCAKEGSDVIINIDNTHQGRRSDLECAVEALKKGGIKELVKECPEVFVKYHTGFEKLAGYINKPNKREKPIVYWYYGKTGTGKTAKVHELEKELWTSNDTLKWFNGYDNEEAVLLDDFRGSHCTFDYLLRLLDGYNMKVEIKGGFVNWNPKRIYVTSCKHPRDVYSDDVFDKDERVDQLLRRITHIEEFKKEGELLDFYDIFNI